MAKKEEQEKKKQSYDDATSSIAALARHAIDPPEGRESEVSYIPVGAMKSLVMLQTYEGYINGILDSVEKQSDWYYNRAEKKMGRLLAQNKITPEEVAEYLISVKPDDEDNKFDTKTLFIHTFRHAYYQHTRGKEGKLMEVIAMLADTEMQTRNPDMEQGFSARVQ